MSGIIVRRSLMASRNYVFHYDGALKEQTWWVVKLYHNNFSFEQRKFLSGRLRGLPSSQKRFTEMNSH